MSLPEFLSCSLTDANGDLDKKWELAKKHINRVTELADDGKTIDDYSIEIHKTKAIFRLYKN